MDTLYTAKHAGAPPITTTPQTPDWSAQIPPPLTADVLSRLLFSPPPHLFLFSIFESIGRTVGRRPPAVLLRV